MKKKQTTMLIIVAVAIAAIYFIVLPMLNPNDLKPGEVPDGVWDEVTHQCLPSRAGISFGQCCFDIDMKQKPCNEDTAEQAIYQGTKGTFGVAHFVSVKNTGNVDLTGAYISGATWTPANTELNAKWTPIVGATNTKPILVGQTATWSTDIITLQSVGTGTYGIAIEVTGKATGLQDSKQTKSALITVVTEAIGFSVDIGLGGTS